MDRTSEPQPAAPSATDPMAKALAEELDRRIHEISGLGDDAFGGRLGPRELGAALLAFVVLPGIMVWLFR